MDATGWRISTGLAMAAVGLLALAAGRRRLGPGPGAWAGANAWGLSVGAKLAVAAATYGPLDRWLAGRPGTLAVAGEALYNGLLTGLFEVGLVAWIARRGSLRGAGFPQALRFGLAFGAAEAVSTGLAVAGLAAAATLSPEALPPRLLALVERLLGATGPADLLWAALERGSALAFHAVAVLLVAAGFRAGRPGLGVGAAFLYKGAIDGAAAATFLRVATPSPGEVALFECAVACAALASLLAIPPLRRAMGRGPAPEAGALPVA